MDESISQTLNSFPVELRNRLIEFRQLIVDVADEIEVVGFEECLKWGQISYMSKSGSTMRMGSIGSDNKNFALFFHCQTKLIDTFREVYGDQLKFEGNRAITFTVDQELPVEVLKNCIATGFKYHQLKHLPLLGA